MTQLVVDPTFKALVPRLSEEEVQALTESLLTQGCRDAIKVWRGKIVDGIQRYIQCTKHGIPFRVKELRFANKAEALIWTINNQLGRRNLTKAMRIKLNLEKAELLQKQAKQNRLNPANVHKPINVRKEIAAQAKVSEGTVQKYMRIRRVADPDLLAQVDSGELKIGTAHRMLEVRVVEQLNLSPEGIATVRVNAIKCALDNIKRIEEMYRFIDNQAWFTSDNEDITAVEKLLDRQLVRLHGLACRRVCGEVGA